MCKLICLVVILFLASPWPGRGQTISTTQNFVVKGVVQKLDSTGNTIVIRHDAIPNYMPAMTMPFQTSDTNILRGLQPGDVIEFHLVVTPKEGWIDAITNLHLNVKTTGEGPPPEISPALEPLDPGDLLPDYHFTNELGQPVSLRQFRGQTLVFTFFFTSCPFPDFCPRMTSNFAETEQTLEQMPNAPAPWHLLSISFDPATDTPGRLLAYAQRAHYDPSHWSFLTGDPRQIAALSDQLGEYFWHEGGTTAHNLRTVVVDPLGRIRRIFAGNKWTVHDLIQLILAK